MRFPLKVQLVDSLAEFGRTRSLVVAGLLTGAVYVLVPALLFLLGVTDPMLRYRSRGSFQKQKEDE